MYRWAINFETLEAAHSYHCSRSSCKKCAFFGLLMQHIDECEDCTYLVEKYPDEVENVLLALDNFEKVEEVKLDGMDH